MKSSMMKGVATARTSCGGGSQRGSDSSFLESGIGEKHHQKLLEDY